MVSKKRSIKYQRRKSLIAGYLFLLPSVTVFLFFAIWPLLYTVYLSMMKINILTQTSRFVGLKNFENLFQDPAFIRSLTITVVYTLTTVLASLILGFLFAVLLNQKIRGIRVLRSLFFAPLMTSMVAISVVWMWIYHPDYGVMNHLLGVFGIRPLQWLSSSKTSLLSLIIMGIWKDCSMCTVLYLGAIQNISTDILEAAEMDRTSGFRTLWKIKFPLVAPTTFLILIMQVIQEFQMFTQVNVMTHGGPAGSTQTLVPLMYEKAFTYLDYGNSSAMAVILFLVVLALTIMQNKFSDAKVFYQ